MDPCPDCGEVHEPDLTPVCHPMAPMFITLDPDTNVITVRCAICEEETAKLEVTAESIAMQTEDTRGQRPEATPETLRRLL